MPPRTYHASRALLPDGWSAGVRFTVDAQGTIVRLERGQTAAEGDLRLTGPVLPGMPNLHSHAFQRAMAGLAEIGSQQRDSFWSWREQMYRLVATLTPEQVGVIARTLYVELLKGGYTQVAEFHYLHHAADGQRYDDPAEIALRLSEAASQAGIGMTLLPVLYAHSDFGGRPPSEGQRRFVHDSESFCVLLDRLDSACASAPQHSLGLAFHSLRAVSHAQMEQVLTQRKSGAIHIHVAEQQREVEASLAFSGQRPVAWLLDHLPVDSRWCLVHATHMDTSEARRLAASGAVAGLCPSTEANLGDGLFSMPAYREHGGVFGIGSDSQVSRDVVEELRLLEYGQRLSQQCRNCLQDETRRSVGEWSYQAALAGGARACGARIGALREGYRFDALVLEENDPWLAATQTAHLLDRWLFAGGKWQIAEVYVAGNRVVTQGRHRLDDANRRDLAELLRVLG